MERFVGIWELEFPRQFLIYYDEDDQAINSK